jgi:hypothetical protein
MCDDEVITVNVHHFADAASCAYRLMSFRRLKPRNVILVRRKRRSISPHAAGAAWGM